MELLMTGLGPRASSLTRLADACLPPDSGGIADQPRLGANCGLMHYNIAASLDHLVGPCHHRRREVEAWRLRGLEVDDQLVFGRSLHRQIGRLLALENA